MAHNNGWWSYASFPAFSFYASNGTSYTCNPPFSYCTCGMVLLGLIPLSAWLLLHPRSKPFTLEEAINNVCHFASPWLQTCKTATIQVRWRINMCEHIFCHLNCAEWDSLCCCHLMLVFSVTVTFHAGRNFRTSQEQTCLRRTRSISKRSAYGERD